MKKIYFTVTETDQFFNVAENKNFFVIRKNVCAR
jgi:hypothetical protein